MSKLSFDTINKTLSELKFSSLIFTIDNYGNYTPLDSDWNYKDVPHLNIVHKNVESVQALVADEAVGSINFQKIPFLGFSIPMVLVNYEYDVFNQIYIGSFGPYILVANTITDNASSKTKISTKFAIYSKGVFKYLHKFIKNSIIKNNKILMSEDVPMRERRFSLRHKHCHDFYFPGKTYSFKFTEEIYRANVFIKNGKSSVEVDKAKIINSCENDILGEDDGLLSFFVTKNKNVKYLWPRTCPHEGAELNNKCIIKGRVSCPWHHRRISPLVEIKDEKIKINPSIDYSIIEDGSNLSFTFRNNPEYYNTLPYEIFKKNV